MVVAARVWLYVLVVGMVVLTYSIGGVKCPFNCITIMNNIIFTNIILIIGRIILIGRESAHLGPLKTVSAPSTQRDN